MQLSVAIQGIQYVNDGCSYHFQRLLDHLNITSIKGIIMINHNRISASTSITTCVHCHFAATTECSCQYAAHCIMFNFPIYEDELYDYHSELRQLCQSNGDLFTASLINISKTDLFDWRMLHDNRDLNRKEKHIFSITEIVRVALAVIMLIVTLYQLFVV